MGMTDPRNIAHDKKVAHAKQPAMRPSLAQTRPLNLAAPHIEHHASDDDADKEGLDQ
jgi:hypothetical protein